MRQSNNDPDGFRNIPEFSYRTRRQTPAFDPVMRRIAFGAGGVAALVIVVALVWSGMKPGLGFGPPPVIQAPPGPLRVVPADPGGLTVPEADEQIMSGNNSNAPAQLAPAGVAPDISAFQPPPPPPAAAVVPAAPPPPTAAIQPTASSPAALAPTALAPVTPTVPPPAAGGKIQVQLAAAVDAAGAKTEWQHLNAKMPDLFTGRTPQYTHATVAGVVFWRLRLGGFSDTASASQFCSAVKARGGACTVAAF